MPRCYNCGSSHHYSEKCPKPKENKALKCFGCGGIGHKRENCPQKNAPAVPPTSLWSAEQPDSRPQGFWSAEQPDSRPQGFWSTGQSIISGLIATSTAAVSGVVSGVGGGSSGGNGVSSGGGGNSSVKCYGCGGFGHYRDQCPEANRPKASQSDERFNRTATISLTFDGRWGQGSYFVAPTCLLAVIKPQFIDALNNEGYVDLGKDLDTRNQVPHVNVDGDENIMRQLAGKELTLSVNAFLFNPDCVQIHVGFNRHFTLFFKYGLRNLVGETRLREILFTVLEPHLFPPAAVGVATGLSPSVTSAAESERSVDCCVCLVKKK